MQTRQKDFCPDFQKQGCDKMQCEYEHKYVPCPDYDKGFCYQGPHCPKKHIVRKLCMDYLYGFCKDGPDCKMQHVKLFELSDGTQELRFTERYYQKLKQVNAYRDLPGEFKPVICKSCSEVGHKCNPCKKQLRLSPTRPILCGICDQEHNIYEQGRKQGCVRK